MEKDLNDPRIIDILNEPANRPYRNQLIDIITTLSVSVFCEDESKIFDKDKRVHIYSQSDWNIPFLIKYSTCGEGHGYKHIPDINTLINDFNNKSGADKLRTFWFYFTFPAFEYFP